MFYFALSAKENIQSKFMSYNFNAKYDGFKFFFKHKKISVTLFHMCTWSWLTPNFFSASSLSRVFTHQYVCIFVMKHHGTTMVKFLANCRYFDVGWYNLSSLYKINCSSMLYNMPIINLGSHKKVYFLEGTFWSKIL